MWNRVCLMDYRKAIDAIRYRTRTKEASAYLAPCKTFESGELTRN